MDANDIVEPRGKGSALNKSPPGRSVALKLTGGATDGSIMMFEETVPTGPRACSTCTTAATRWPMS